MNSYHAIEEIMQHLSAQDAELLKHTKMLIHLLSAAGITPEQLPDVRIKNPVFPNETPSAGTQG
jgi:DNA-directed RNA polymerase subunit H (RpoH/RPB5)